MTLSKINDSPLYTTTIPSTKERVKYRPFLVKEERLLLTANESEDVNSMFASLEQVVRNCLMTTPKLLTTFDVEYLFIQIRTKSVGETSDVVMTCKECGKSSDQTIDLKGIDVFTPEGHERNIRLSDTIAATMRYPSVDELLSIQNATDANDAMLKLVKSCIHSVYHGEDCYLIEEESEEEISAFIDTLRSDQYAKLKQFVDTLPYAMITHEWVCPHCNHKETSQLKGLFSFF